MTGDLGYIAEALRPLAVPVGELHEDPTNARKGHAVDRIAASLKTYGQRKPIVANRGQNNKIEAGNGTFRAAKSLGWSHIAVVWVDDDPATAAGYGIADNRLGDLSEWDTDVLADVVGSLDDMFTGFTGAELDELLPDRKPALDDPGAQVDKAEELRVKWGVEAGQLWALGEHRLVCGDCTDAATVRRVMGGEKAVLLFTSPPYAQQRDYKKRIDNWDRLMQGCFQSVQMEENGQVLVNLGIVHVDGEWVPYWDNWIEWMRSVGWKRFGFYVWDKTFALPGDWNGRLAPAHEFIFHFCKQKKRPRKVVRSKWAGKVIHEGDATGLRAADGSMSGWTHAGKATQKWRIPESVARVEPPEFWHGAEAETEVEWFDIPQSVARVSPAMGGVDGHPAPFSVALASWAVDPWSEIGEIVYEPFSGSGTTLIACERLGRRCRAVEIEPGYVAVALERWSVMTGRTPEVVA